MPDLKHVGRIRSNGRKVLVAYRTLPGDSSSALIVQTENLSDDQHDAIIRLVESPAAQSAHEFAEALARSKFPDGSTMLAALHVQGRLQKVSTSEVEMTPNNQISVGLDELNRIIAEQLGVSIDDLAIKPNSEAKEIATVSEVPTTEVAAESQVANIETITPPLSDADLAKKYRSDADRLSKEAAQLRRMAEELVPTKKKSTATA